MKFELGLYLDLVINGTEWNINFMKARSLLVLNGGNTIINKKSRYSINIHSINK